MLERGEIGEAFFYLARLVPYSVLGGLYFSGQVGGFSIYVQYSIYLSIYPSIIYPSIYVDIHLYIYIYKYAARCSVTILTIH